MSALNPTIPTATQAKGIDAHVLDLQLLLDTNLNWLTNGLGRAYTLSKVRGNGVTQFLPQIYLGTSTSDYFQATQASKNKGQNFISVGNEAYPLQDTGRYGRLSYPISIVFSANLKLVDATLLLTEDFTEHLMEDVRQVLIRETLGKDYQIELNNGTRDFTEVWSGWDIDSTAGKTNKQYLPMTYFRFDGVISFYEDCAGSSLNRCAAITQNLSADDKLNCILPTYDFADATTQAATTAQQQAQMTAWLCTSSFSNLYSMVFNATNQYINCGQYATVDFTNASTFTLSCWVRSTSWASTRMIMGKRNASSVGYNIFSQGGKLRLVFRGGATSNAIIIDTTAAMTDNIWYHIAVTYDGSGTAAGTIIYIDGVAAGVTVVQTNVSSTLSNANDFHIGGSNGAFLWGGDIDIVRVWDLVLTPAEVLDEYNTRIPKAPVQANNLVLINNMGDDATFDGTNWTFPNPNLIAGSKSVLMTLGSRTSNTPF